MESDISIWANGDFSIWRLHTHTIGIDTGKNTLHLIGLDEKAGNRFAGRGRITARLANVARCLIGIEAGTATHYVARERLHSVMM